jgi:hypothetical protein
MGFGKTSEPVDQPFGGKIRRGADREYARALAPPLVQKQFDDLPAISVEEVKAMLDSGKRVQIIDAHYTTRGNEIMERRGMA